jgi:hypothetical protein
MKQIEVTAMTKAAAKATVLRLLITNPSVAAIVPKWGSQRKERQPISRAAPRQAMAMRSPIPKQCPEGAYPRKSTASLPVDA